MIWAWAMSRLLSDIRTTSPSSSPSNSSCPIQYSEKDVKEDFERTKLKQRRSRPRHCADSRSPRTRRRRPPEQPRTQSPKTTVSKEQRTSVYIVDPTTQRMMLVATTTTTTTTTLNEEQVRNGARPKNCRRDENRRSVQFSEKEMLYKY